MQRFTQVIIVIAAVAITVGVVERYLDTKSQANDLKRAICTLRAERIRAVRRAEAFLQEHPKGIPGVSRADILASVKLQRETIQAFSHAHCAPVPP